VSDAAPGELVFDDVNGDIAVLRVGKRVGVHLFRRDAAQLEALGGFVVDRPSVHLSIVGGD
jgi:hypothetical protein